MNRPKFNRLLDSTFFRHALGIWVAALMMFVVQNVRADHLDHGDIDVAVIADRGGVLHNYPVYDRQQPDTTRAYLEAVPGQHYSIRVRNRGAERIGVVIAVDGRNIVSGKKSTLGHRERMYILGPYQSATYRGWRTDRDTVNRFYFTDSGDTYAEAFGDTSAMGVIAVAAYRERRRHTREHQPYARPDNPAGDHDNRSLNSGKDGNRSAPAQKHAYESDNEPGTGFGEERHSPSVRVSFDPERHAFERHFLKYEWRKTLCDREIIDCYRTANRFWDDRHYSRRGFAPYPPGRRPAHSRAWR